MTKMMFYVPGAKRYDNGRFANTANSFVNISITGTDCQCRCEHCRGKLLDSMFAAPEPDLLITLAADLKRRGCRGVLISGGACHDGSVPLAPFTGALNRLVAMGLAVVVHPGLLTGETANLLATAGVSRVALDLIGDSDTIRSVYHLERTPQDYRDSLKAARRAGLKTAPHIVVGLHYGQIRGEYEALDMAASEGADSLSLVILKPLPGTPMQHVAPPGLAEVERFFLTARRLMPRTPIALGCARPAGRYARMVERLAVRAGFDAIAYPSRETVDYVSDLGLEADYAETCCGMITP